jgi:L-fuconolactonase
MQRRDFLAGAAALALEAHGTAAIALADIPIIDTHVHLFDARRPQGVPYSGSAEWAAQSGGVALPSTYRAYARPLNIVGAIAVEASPWVEDNLWVLEQLEASPLFVGTIGDLEPETPGFPELLERHRKNPLFLGLRCGNIWDRDIAAQSRDEKFLDGLRRVADAGLVMDTANPTVPLLEAIARISDRIAPLRIVLDHLPALSPRPQEQAAYEAVLRDLAGRPQIFAKLSAIEQRGGPHGLAAHKERLDFLMAAFGEDRVVFGTDWPNSWGIATPAQIVALAHDYFATRTHAAAEKFFWKNSLAAYRWRRRAANQPN